MDIDPKVLLSQILKEEIEKEFIKEYGCTPEQHILKELFDKISPTERRDLVECSACHHIQYEVTHPLDKGGKYAWGCRACRKANEGSGIHLLENTARFNSK